MKIVVLDGYVLNPGDLSWQGLEALGTVTVYDRTSKEQVIERIGDAEYVFTNKTVLTAETFEACPNLKWVGVLATGYNVVDLEAASKHHVPVCNVPAYSTEAVAQFTFALLLELCHHVGLHHEAIQEGEWQARGEFSFWKTPLVELSGKTFGIIGLGRIGQATGRLAKAFGMKVIAYSRHPKEELMEEGFSYVMMDTLLQESDVISLHCALTEENAGLINKSTIAKMKDRVRILNTARGGLVNEVDLAEALQVGKVAGAAVDVVSTEPIDKANPLLKAPNCIITPHIAWAPQATRQRLMEIAVNNLKSFLEGKPLNVVNELNA